MAESFFQDQMRRHTERFRCAICGTPSSGPAYESLDGLTYAWSNWNRPADLHWCRDCGQHVCAEHFSMSNGRCTACMEKRYPRTRLAAD